MQDLLYLDAKRVPAASKFVTVTGAAGEVNGSHSKAIAAQSGNNGSMGPVRKSLLFFCGLAMAVCLTGCDESSTASSTPPAAEASTRTVTVATVTRRLTLQRENKRCNDPEHCGADKGAAPSHQALHEQKRAGRDRGADHSGAGVEGEDLRDALRSDAFG